MSHTCHAQVPLLTMPACHRKVFLLCIPNTRFVCSVTGVVRTPGSAHGIFPRGCKWRDVQIKGPGQPKKHPFWAAEDYEYWDEARGRWQNKQPDACLVRGLQGGTEGCAAS